MNDATVVGLLMIFGPILLVMLVQTVELTARRAWRIRREREPWDIIPAGSVNRECTNGHVWRYLRTGWELRGEDGVFRTEKQRAAVKA